VRRYWTLAAAAMLAACGHAKPKPVVAARPAASDERPLPPLGVERMPGDSALSGIVRDDSTGQPVVRSLVTVDRNGARAFTDSLGRFRIVGVASGPHTLWTRMIGYHPRIDDVEVVDGQGLDVTIAIQRSKVVLMEVCACDAISVARLLVNVRVAPHDPPPEAMIVVKRGRRVAEAYPVAPAAFRDGVASLWLQWDRYGKVTVEISAPGFHRWRSGTIQLPDTVDATLTRKP
jgi:hypothetical protein